MSDVRTLDVSALPPGAFGSRTVTFWGTLGIIVIESTVFALAIGAYFFLVTRFPTWPPHGVAAPDLRWGTLNTLILLASLLPNELARRAGEHVNLDACGSGWSCAWYSRWPSTSSVPTNLRT